MNKAVFNFISQTIFNDPGYLHKHLQSYLMKKMSSFGSMPEIEKDTYLKLMRVSNQLDIMLQHGIRPIQIFTDEYGKFIIQDFEILNWWKQNDYIGVEKIEEIIYMEIKAEI